MTSLATQPQAPADLAAPPGRPRVLLLTHRLPYPPDRGDRIRSFNLVKTLSQHFDLAVACTSEEPVWLQHHQLLMTMASRVVIQPISARWSKVRAVTGLLTGSAITPECFYRQGLADTILQWHEQKPFDLVLTFCTGMVRYARLLVHGPGRKHNPNIRHVLDLVDVDSEKWRSYARSTWSPMKLVYATEARRLRRVEAGATDRYDAVTVISGAEAECYRQNVGDHPGLHVVRNGVDTDYFRPQVDPGDSRAICFVGVLNYRPNTKGITWFARRVMPLLLKRVPDAKLLIVGRNPTPRVLELGRLDGVDVVGSVPDVRMYIAQSAAVIAPLQIARGTQNKVLEAMSCGRVVVCSPAAAAGIDATDGEHLLVADSPAKWVDQIEQAITDEQLRTRVAAAARRRVEEFYTWDQALKPMVDLLHRTALPG